MSMSNEYGKCEICNQRTWEDSMHDGICFSCLEKIENEELICCNCEVVSEELNDDGICPDCSEPDDSGDGDFNARGGYTQSYINYLNSQFR